MASDSFEEEELQEILEEVARNNGFDKPKYEVTAATKAGDNYVGRVVRVVIRDGASSKKDPLSVIFKIAPVSKVRRDTFRSGIIFRNEGKMYQVVLPKLNALLKEHGLSDSDTYPCTARCLSSKLSEDSSENAIDVLVLEDMAPKGYSMVDRSVGLDASKCRLILCQLARLHGASLALRHLRPDEATQLESNIREVFLNEDNLMLNEMEAMLKNSLRLVEDRYPEGTPEHDTLKHFIEHYIEEMFYLVKPNNQLSCVTHGDCWSNNVLFKFDKTGQAENICLLDFQISRVASPVLDVVYLLFTCTTKKTRDAHYQNLLQGYFDELSSTLSKLGCDPEAVVPWSVFEDQLKAYGRYGIALALVTTPLFLADSSEVPQNIDEMMENGTHSVSDIFGAVSIKKLDAVKERVSDVLQDVLQLGYL